jgi:hypothetical protein
MVVQYGLEFTHADLPIGSLKEIIIGCIRYQQRLQQTKKYPLFVFIFGCSFSIG